MSLSGWHIGEKIVHKKLGLEGDPSVAYLYTFIQGDLPPDHAQFHSSNLPFLPLTTLDADGRPWGSILASESGEPGFIKHPKYTTLSIKANVWEGDPLHFTSDTFSENRSMLVAGIGIEFPTRRRNKLAGKLTKLERQGNVYDMELVVNQAIGNCPKYINIRDLIPHPSAKPEVKHKVLSLDREDRLPEDVISFIHDADTVFFGTSYVAPPGESSKFPSHVGMNQRGGRQGFIRVRPSDGRTVALPDYSGNRFMTSLGNVEATPLACLTFVSFTTGDVLYLTGEAKNLFGADAQELMLLQNSLTTVFVTGYVFTQDSLPVRQRPGTAPQRSPYSPPIRLLNEEATQTTILKDSDKTAALLRSIDILSQNIAVFTFDISRPVSIIPGQAAILDLSSLLGAKEYQHMAPYQPTSLNDDRIRTWTVSSSYLDGNTQSFTITMRHKPRGTVTTALFAIAQKLHSHNPGILRDTRPLEINLNIIGVSGDFTLPPYSREASIDSPHLTKKLLWIAGGIGITPFLSMLKELAVSPGNFDWDIQFALSTREPEILLPLISAALQGAEHVGVSLHVFSAGDIPDATNPIFLTKHVGRLNPSSFLSSVTDLKDRSIYLCGPDSFEKIVLGSLVDSGVQADYVKREGFEY